MSTRTSRAVSDGYGYDDRRRLSGNPVHDGRTMRTAIERFFAQYNRFGDRMLAVRGERLAVRLEPMVG